MLMDPPGWTTVLMRFSHVAGENEDVFLIHHNGPVCEIFLCVDSKCTSALKAAGQGDTVTQDNLGICYKKGPGVPQDVSDS
jgi:hypothetical protein